MTDLEETAIPKIYLYHRGHPSMCFALHEDGRMLVIASPIQTTEFMERENRTYMGAYTAAWTVDLIEKYRDRLETICSGGYELVFCDCKREYDEHAPAGFKEAYARAVILNPPPRVVRHNPMDIEYIWDSKKND